MIPAIVLVGIGEHRRFWLPLPVFLLWPLWAAAWMLWVPMRILRVSGQRRLWLVLTLSGRMSGLSLDVKSKEGQHIQIRMI